MIDAGKSRRVCGGDVYQNGITSNGITEGLNNDVDYN